MTETPLKERTLVRNGRWAVPPEDRPSGWEEMELGEIAPEPNEEEPTQQPVAEVHEDPDPIDDHPLVKACRRMPREFMPVILSKLSSITEGRKAELALCDMAIGILEILRHLDYHHRNMVGLPSRLAVKTEGNETE